jgi:hypothetical protein
LCAGSDLRHVPSAGGLGVQLHHRRLHPERIPADLALQVRSLEARANEAARRRLETGATLQGRAKDLLAASICSGETMMSLCKACSHLRDEEFQ